MPPPSAQKNDTWKYLKWQVALVSPRMFSPDFNLSKWPKTLNSKQRYNIEFQWVYYPFPAFISLHNLFLFTRFYWSIALTVIIDPCCNTTTSWYYPVNHVIYSWFIDKNRCGNISSTVSHRKLAYIIGQAFVNIHKISNLNGHSTGRGKAM